MEKIGYTDGANGEKKPHTISQFAAKFGLFGYELDGHDILMLLIVIVCIAIAVGLIVMFGWMGLAMVFGGLILGTIIWIAVTFSGDGFSGY